jgi:uroporphyrinogen-III synthase
MLLGQHILITRPKEQAQKWANELLKLGTEVTIFPLVEIKYIDTDEVRDICKKVNEYDWLIFTSANGVEGFTRLIQSAHQEINPSINIAAVGPITAQKLLESGLNVKEMPEDFTGKNMAVSLGNLKGEKILFPTTPSATQDTIKTLVEQGAEVKTVFVYKTIKRTEGREELQEILNNDIFIITFTSPSAVEAFVDMNVAFDPVSLIAVIGPSVEKRAEELGLRVDIVAKEHTIEGLTKAISESHLIDYKINLS